VSRFVGCTRSHDHWTGVVKLVSEVVKATSQIERQLFLFR